MLWVRVTQHIAYEPLGLGRRRLHPSEQLSSRVLRVLQGVALASNCNHTLSC